MTQLKWLWANASWEESATNGVTIIHKKQRKVSRYSGASICKEKISPEKISRPVCETLFKIQLSTNFNNFQQESNLQTKTEQSTNPKKLYVYLCLPIKTHDASPVRK